MSKKFIILLFSVFTSFGAFAQTGYKEGYVVTLNGDTLRGYIDHKEWSENPKDILFKTSENGTEQHFGLNNAKSFSITGYEAYEKWTVPISLNTLNQSKLTDTVDTRKIVSEVFLSLLLKGDKFSLYSYKDNTKTRYYILERSSGTPQELLYTLNMNAGKLLSSYTFRVQLKEYADKQNSPATLTTLIETSFYSKSDLVKITKALNTESQLTQTIKPKRFRLVAGGGISLNKVIHDGGLNDITVNPDGSTHKSQVVTNSTAPRFSLAFDMFANPNFKRLFIRGELSATKIISETHSITPYAALKGNTLVTYKLDALVLSFIPQVVYCLYNKPNFKFFAGGGAALNVISANRNEILRESDQGEFTPFVIKNTYKISKDTFSPRLLTGFVLYENIEVMASYSSPVKMAVGLEVHTIQVGVNYIFNRK